MPRTFVTTSWDDGHPADLRIAEMLDRHGLTGTFYIPRSIQTGVMSDSQIRDLSSRFEIGAHTLNHVFLGSDDDDATSESEIGGSKAWVEEVTGRPCSMFCPPAGKFDARHLPMFRRAGFVGIRTVEFMSLDRPRNCGGLLEMPTTLQAFPHSAWTYAKNAMKRHSVRNLLLYSTRGRTQNWRLLSRRLLDRAIEAGGVFHLWGHSWEIEKSGEWSHLEEVLKALGQARGNAPCMTNGKICQQTSGSFSV